LQDAAGFERRHRSEQGTDAMPDTQTPEKFEETLDWRRLVNSLRSDTCPACGGYKRGAISVCPKCWRGLPKAKQQRMYDRIGEGYQEAMIAALRHLGVTRFVDPKTPAI
jgi:tRNA(Ile2) C34 agmatinyltransferase TiaS